MLQKEKQAELSLQKGMESNQHQPHLQPLTPPTQPQHEKHGRWKL